MAPIIFPKSHYPASNKFRQTRVQGQTKYAVQFRPQDTGAIVVQSEKREIHQGLSLFFLFPSQTSVLMARPFLSTSDSLR